MQRIKGFSYRSKKHMNRCCPNAVKESRSERVGLYRNEQGGFACLALLKILYLFIGLIELIVGSTSIERGQIPATDKENTINQMHNMMHDHDMSICCGLS